MNSINNLLPILEKDFPDIEFIPGEVFYWSPRENKITYTTHQANADHGVWALLHELAHATLGHEHYENDFELVRLESATWQQARILAKKYGISINSDHIQDCLDTYRDWLYSRAKCPECSVVSIQRTDGLYQCFNCKTTWKVSKSPLCRANRQVVAQ
jgi:hypothetical protein